MTTENCETSLAVSNRQEVVTASAARRLTTKKSSLITLLRARNGARTPTICKSLGWQKHTVRAALSGLRKEGHVITASKSARDEITVYRMETSPEGTA